MGLSDKDKFMSIKSLSSDATPLEQILCTHAVVPVMVLGERFSTPGLHLRPWLGGIRPEGMGGRQAKGEEGKGGHVEAAVVGVPVRDVGLAAAETTCSCVSP